VALRANEPAFPAPFHVVTGPRGAVDTFAQDSVNFVNLFSYRGHQMNALAPELVLSNGTVHTPSGPILADVAVRDGKIVGIGSYPNASERIDCTGLDVLPGVIDSQVHFREPGLEHKEDLETGSRAAVMGGVTAVFEMPNTNPNTDTAERVADKLERAHHRMWCDHAFYVGATADNAEHLGELEKIPGTAGIKIFMGASTGSLLVSEDADLARVLAQGNRRVAIHAEDEARMNDRKDLRVEGDASSHPVWRDDESAMLATRRILRLASEARRPIHILHVTTPAELELIAQYRDIATCEVTPQHLTLRGEDAYPRLGSYAQMNPPIRSGAHVDGLWHWLRQGVPDVIGSDHAPHTIAEKARIYPASPSGMPGVQTLLPLMLDHVANGRMTLDRLIDMTSAGPQRIFGLVGKGRIAVGYDADFSIVDLKAKWTVSESWLESRCGWSPFTGMDLTGKVMGTVVRGNRVMWDGQLANAAVGEKLRFVSTLRGA
jgi:dihydroorotase